MTVYVIVILVKTFELGLLQAKAYRILKRQTKKSLSAFSIDDIEWSILGLLSGHGQLTSSELAVYLGVKKPFINKLAAELINKNLVEKVDHEIDRRSFYYQLSAIGNELVVNIETKLVKDMKKLVEPVSLFELRGYKKTLEKIIKNDTAI